ncbi:MAG: tetratricopeptide repeat protein, partial [Vicinamibacterales bacterium]
MGEAGSRIGTGRGPVSGRGARRGLAAVMAALAVVLGACATRTIPPVPTAPAFPEFLYPSVPDGTDVELVSRIEVGWRYLQLRNFRNADREFQAALSRQAAFAPAEAGLGWVALASRDPEGAAGRFERALAATPAYVPALVGRGRALLELGRDDDALASFEAALAADPSLAEVKSRVEVLRFRATQENLARAQAARQAGRLDEARAAYERALAGSPESAFLYRELAGVERQAGDREAALGHYRRAVALDPMDAAAFAGLGAVLEEQGDAAGAVTAYEQARALDEAAVSDEALARARAAAELARLPAEYRAIESAPAI